MKTKQELVDFWQKFKWHEIKSRGPAYSELADLRDELESTMHMHAHKLELVWNENLQRHIHNRLEREHVRELIKVIRKLGLNKNRRRALRQLNNYFDEVQLSCG